ncbi:MAG TPA: Bax inhibitor-1/YccA family protein [Pseudoclavibacter sp.]|nr:Bax inhibitor-1/YccA family protein [Pseudoclavibacter sp.]
MALENPALANNAALKEAKASAQRTYTAEELRAMYEQPSAAEPSYDPPVTPSVPRENALSYDDVIAKTAVTLGLVIVSAAIGWFVPSLMLPGMLIGLVLGLVNSFKREPSPALILGYAVAEGLFIGGISSVLESVYSGIVVQAALATLSVFAVMLALFASGKVRASAKLTKIALVAMGGYLLFSLINVALQLTGVVTDPWGLMTSVTIAGIPLGVIVGVVAVLLAAYSFVMDFDYAQQGVRTGIDRKYAWSIAFGLTVTLIWLYVEFLRLIAIFREQ